MVPPPPISKFFRGPWVKIDYLKVDECQLAHSQVCTLLTAYLVQVFRTFVFYGLDLLHASDGNQILTPNGNEND